MNDGFIYTLKGKKIRDILCSFPIFNTEHHVLDRQGIRNVHFLKQVSLELKQSLPSFWTVPSLPHYWALDRPKVKLAFEFQLTLNKHKATAAYFPNMLREKQSSRMSYRDGRLNVCQRMQSI